MAAIAIGDTLTFRGSETASVSDTLVDVGDINENFTLALQIYFVLYIFL